MGVPRTVVGWKGGDADEFVGNGRKCNSQEAEGSMSEARVQSADDSFQE